MIGQKVTLTAATATKIATGQVGNTSLLLKTALTDCALGAASVTVAAGFVLGTVSGILSVPIGRDDLYIISTGGGDIYVLYPESG